MAKLNKEMIARLVRAAGILAASAWLIIKVYSPEARAMAERMRALQRQANHLSDLPSVALHNRLATWRWLGRLKPDAIQSHTEACTAPSTTLRFLPLVGEVLLARRFAEYSSCMEILLLRAHATHICVLCVACVAEALAVSLAWWFMWPHLRLRCEGLTFMFFRRGKKREDDDEEFLRRRVPFLTEEELLSLGPVSHLARGCFGSVTRLTYEGRDAIIKRLRDCNGAVLILREARTMLEVEKAGGVPEVLAVCLDPPAMVQVFVGNTYVKYLQQSCVGGFLDSLVTIGRLIGEIHAKGIAHNDVRAPNITFTGSVREPDFHMIDLGLACRFGHVATELLLRYSSDQGAGSFVDWSVPSQSLDLASDEEENSAPQWSHSKWLAPEVILQRPVFASGDVYSLGVLVMEVASGCEHAFLIRHLWKVARLCLPVNPRRRCSLDRVTEAIVKVKSQLLPDQLSQTLGVFLQITDTGSTG